MPDIFISEKKEEVVSTTPKEKVDKLESIVHEKKIYKHTIPGHSHSPLAAFCYLPDAGTVNFETQEKEERVILLLRKHLITNLGWILVAILMGIAPGVLSSFPLLSFLPANFQFVAVLGWYLITIAYALEGFLSWYFNVYIVTDERIIDIDFYNLIYKEVADTNIDKIQDVTYKMGGVVRTIFNYGDVLIQTAAEVPNFDFLAVPMPDKVVSILQELRIEEQQEVIEGRVR